MENSRWAALKGSVGFYAALAAVLIAAAVGGWLLLFRGDAEPSADLETVPELPVSAPRQPEAVETAKPAEPVETVETLEPVELLPEEPAVMPEAEIDAEPVAAVQPRLTVQPLEGQVVTAFAMDKLVYNPTLEDWRTHEGVDIAAQEGDPVLAACAGVITGIADDPLMGTTITIDHDGGYQTTYANLQEKAAVELGDPVSAGETIGAVGTTAAAESAQDPHLHFAVTKDGEPVDPEEFLGS